LQAWKGALNWYFRRGREVAAVIMKGVPPLARSDLGAAPWEAALIAHLRQRGRSWRTEQTYRGWVWRFVRWLANGERGVRNAERERATANDAKYAKGKRGNIEEPTSNSQPPMAPSGEHATFNLQHSTESKGEHRTSNIEHRTSNSEGGGPAEAGTPSGGRGGAKGEPTNIQHSTESKGEHRTSNIEHRTSNSEGGGPAKAGTPSGCAQSAGWVNLDP
jgi:hypothetical protein